MDFATHIRALRKARGLTQEQLAQQAGMSLRAFSSLERGEADDPHYSSLEKIANGLGLSVVEFLSAEEE